MTKKSKNKNLQSTHSFDKSIDLRVGGASDESQQIDFHAMPVVAVLRKFGVTQECGLTSQEVAVLQDEHGLNKIEEPDSDSLLKRIFQEITNPLVLILVFALGLTLFLGEYIDALVVALAIIINIGIALYQEGQAKDIFESLEKEQASQARVCRDGDNKVIDSTRLVPGDVVYVASGSRIPADIRVIDSEDAEADEAALTGEWESVSKSPSPVDKKTSLADQSSMLFAGTLLASGAATGVVVATGARTEFGKISETTIRSENELTPLQKQLKKLAYIISTIVVGLSILILVIGLMRDMPFAEILFIAIAIAVSAVPEGLPSAITAILAVGMRNVLEKDGLVKSLLAAETLGATDVIISDKTGTLTEGKMSLVSLIPGFTDQAPETNDVTELNEHTRTLLRSALLASDGYVTTNDEGEPVANGRPIEKALVAAGIRLGLPRDDLNNDDEELDFLPFSSERRFAAVMVEGKHGHYAILSGAPEYMVSSANFYYDKDGTPTKMDDKTRARLGDIQTTLSSRAQRLTGVARVPIEAHKFDELDDENILKVLAPKLEFVGFVGFTDPVRGNVPKSIRLAQEAGARVIVATGDNRNTALAIAKQAGVITGDNVIEGKDMVDLSEEKIYELFQETSVFARMRPNQKLRLAKALQKHGHVVSMTGDGINDAPALANADVGVAVHSGTDVAKSAADLILLKNSFATIVEAIREGRKLLDNIRRVVVHRITAGFSEVFLVIAALLFGLMIPILPKQILWVNIIQGGLLTFAFAFEPADKNVMKRPPNAVGSRGILNDQVRRLLIYSSIAFGIITISAYFIANLYFGLPIETLRTLMFVILTLDTIVFSFALKDFNRPMWKINLFSNRFLLLAITLSVSAFLATMFVPVLRNLLELQLLSPTLWMVIAAIGVIEVLIIEAIKYVSKKMTNDQEAGPGVVARAQYQ